MDSHAFERQLDQHRDSVYRQMVRVCGDYDDADDALAEAMLLAFRASESLQHPENFRAWLAIIGRRVCARMRLHQSLRPLMDLAEVEVAPDHSPTPEQQAFLSETKDCISGALSALPDDLREVYLLREVEQRSGQEVADQLGISVPAMKSRLRRAREALRKLMDRAVCT